MYCYYCSYITLCLRRIKQLKHSVYDKLVRFNPNWSWIFYCRSVTTHHFRILV